MALMTVLLGFCEVTMAIPLKRWTSKKGDVCTLASNSSDPKPVFLATSFYLRVNNPKHRPNQGPGHVSLTPMQRYHAGTPTHIKGD